MATEGYRNNPPQRPPVDNGQYRASDDDGTARNNARRDDDRRDDDNRDNDNMPPPAVNNDSQVPPGSAVASPVPEGSFTDAASEKLKVKVDAKTTDTEKLKLMKEALRRETVTTFQVGTMLDWFLFESTRLEFAKWAYSITTDKDFYNDLASKFSYESSKEELAEFLKSR
jgi:hypothetical protein